MYLPPLAVLITCHNRCETTLKCLQNLYQQNIDLDIYLVDDGSTDGTADAIKISYPAVKILQGTGNLFWVGGMRLAFAEALQHNYDYYLWLNDDTYLDSDAINKLLTNHRQLSENNQDNSLIIGSTRDPISNKTTYGGAIRSQLWYSNKYELLEPNQQLQQCDTMFGNCVLIPRVVAQKVGNLDAAFIHSLGDIDYGLRAKQQGCSIWIAPGYIGTCAKNKLQGSWVDTNLNIFERLNKASQPKAFPIKSWTVFTRRHSGLLWFAYWFLPYLRAVIGYKNLNASATFSQ